MRVHPRLHEHDPNRHELISGSPNAQVESGAIVLTLMLASGWVILLGHVCLLFEASLMKRRFLRLHAQVT